MAYEIDTGWWFLATALKNITSSVGMMKFPIYGKIENVPNHQPVKMWLEIVINHLPNHNVYRWDSNLSVMGGLWHCFNHVFA